MFKVIEVIEVKRSVFSGYSTWHNTTKNWDQRSLGTNFFVKQKCYNGVTREHMLEHNTLIDVHPDKDKVITIPADCAAQLSLNIVQWVQHNGKS